MNRTSLLMVAILAVAVQAAPAHAWVFEDDGETWPLFSFHRYGGDVNRPAATPDRPYFHGDDAVPPGLRWRDLQQAEAEDAAAAAAVRVEVVARHRPRRHVVRHSRRVHRQPVVCLPARPAATP